MMTKCWISLTFSVGFVVLLFILYMHLHPNCHQYGIKYMTNTMKYIQILHCINLQNQKLRNKKVIINQIEQLYLFFEFTIHLVWIMSEYT